MDFKNGIGGEGGRGDLSCSNFLSTSSESSKGEGFSEGPKMGNSVELSSFGDFKEDSKREDSIKKLSVIPPFLSTNSRSTASSISSSSPFRSSSPNILSIFHFPFTLKIKGFVYRYRCPPCTILGSGPVSYI